MGRIRVSPLEPRRKRRGSDKPIITPHRIHGCVLMGCFVGRAAVCSPRARGGGSAKHKQCPLGRIRAAALEPRRKRRGSGQPIMRVKAE
jgi:hypothetical protein